MPALWNSQSPGEDADQVAQPLPLVGPSAPSLARSEAHEEAVSPSSRRLPISENNEPGSDGFMSLPLLENSEPAGSHSAHRSDTSPTVPTSPGLRRWKPRYLQLGVLSAFVVCFGLLIITIETLLAFSDKHQGLATAYSGLHYLWSYGPTAVFTIITALWTRVEFQAMLMAPWRRVVTSNHPVPSKQSLRIDYLDLWTPKVLIQAFKNRDWHVASAMSVGLLLLVATVLSTSLMTLTPVNVVESIPITLQTKFSNDPSRLNASGLHPYLTMFGLVNNSLPYPDGTSRQFAYQTFRSIYSEDAIYGVQTTIDGVSVDLECQEAQLTYFSNRPGNENGPRMNLSITTPGGCQLDYSPPFEWAEFDGHLDFFCRYWIGFCANRPDPKHEPKDVRIGMVLLALESHDSTDGHDLVLNRTIKKSTQIICYPTYSVQRLDVTSLAKNITSIRKSSSASPPRILPNITNINMAQAVESILLQDSREYPNICGGNFRSLCDTGLRMDLDSRMLLALLLFVPRPLPAIELLFNLTLLQDLTSRLFEQLVIQLIHEATEPTFETSQGTAVIRRDRLLVRPFAVHTLVALLAISALLALFIISKHPGAWGFRHPPNTIAGLALIFNSSRYTVNLPREEGEGGKPLILRPASKVLATLVSCAIIATLEVMLRKSQGNGGIADIKVADSFVHYFWTLGPGTVLRLLSLYYSTADFTQRSYQPLCNINKLRASKFSFSVGLNLIDRSLLTIFTTAFRTHGFVTLSLTTARFASSWFTIFSASLFIAQSLPIMSKTQLRVKDSFRTSLPSWYSPNDQGPTDASLILKNNMSYPTSTYQDLVFPQLELISPFAVGNGTPTNMLPLNVTSTLPALRARMICKLHDSSAVQISRHDSTSSLSIAISNPLGGLYCRGNLDVVDCGLNITTGAVVVGQVAKASRHGSNEPFIPGGIDDCNGSNPGMFFYVWGQVSELSVASQTKEPNTTRILQQETSTAHALGCWEDIESVEVDVQLFGPHLQLEPLYPPIIRNNSSTGIIITAMQPNITTMQMDRSGNSKEMSVTETIYDSLPYTHANTDDELLDEFFHLLTTSRFAIPRSYLTDPDKAEAIADAIRFQHGIIRAQSLNMDYRTSLQENGSITIRLSDEPSDTSPEPPSTPVFEALITDPQARTRLFQDQAATRILQALLLTTLLLSSHAWLLPHLNTINKKKKSKVKLPNRSPTSVVGTMALLADSNIWDFFKPGPQAPVAPPRKERQGAGNNSDGQARRNPPRAEIEYGDLERIFEGCRFRLCWRDDPGATISCCDDGNNAEAVAAGGAEVEQGLEGNESPKRMFALIVERDKLVASDQICPDLLTPGL